MFHRRSRVVAAFAAIGMAVTAQNGHLSYPLAPKGDQVDDYHGVKISDPYGGLEDADSPATQKWVEDENKLTFGYLAKLPGREKIKEQLTELWNFERYGGFSKEGPY